MWAKFSSHVCMCLALLYNVTVHLDFCSVLKGKHDRLKYCCGSAEWLCTILALTQQYIYVKIKVTLMLMCHILGMQETFNPPLWSFNLSMWAQGGNHWLQQTIGTWWIHLQSLAAQSWSIGFPSRSLLPPSEPEEQLAAHHSRLRWMLVCTPNWLLIIRC